MINTLILSSPKDAHRALVIASRTNANSPAEMMIAGAKAAMIVELKKRMQTSVVEFYFFKKNGQKFPHAGFVVNHQNNCHNSPWIT